MITLLLLVRATYAVLFFAHIPFVVNRAFSATPAGSLQHYWAQAIGDGLRQPNLRE